MGEFSPDPKDYPFYHCAIGGDADYIITDNRISVRFEYEWRDAENNWFRSHGNEHWEFDHEGLMRRRDASINYIPIQESERRYFESRAPTGSNSANRLGSYA